MGRRLAGLAGIVEDQVVPRLVEAHRPNPNEPTLAETLLQEPKAGVVETLAELVVVDGEEAKMRVQTLLDDGMSIEAIYLNVLAPTARLLGRLWEEDERHFADVTVGVGRLQQMLHDFEAAFQSAAIGWQPAQRVLLMPAPHEQHTFGLFMIGQFMRRAGWDAWTGPLPPDRKLKQLVRDGDFGVVGFSASADCRIESLTSVIAMVRQAAKDRRICVMVGGHAFASRPALVEAVGADGTALDARSAIKLAHQLLGERENDY
ncbi:MAG: cobalamin-dependent protein [Pseudomonadota bacterium]